MKSFLKWLASSPTASVLKIAFAGLLATGVDALNSFHLPTSIIIIITALVPVIVDALNPHDPRFGKGKAPSLEDFLTALVPALEKAVPAEAPIVEAVAPALENAVNHKKS